MRLLLDTHAFIWATTAPGQLSSQARDAIRDGEADLYLSAVSAYEIDFKREFSPNCNGFRLIWMTHGPRFDSAGSALIVSI